MTIRKRPIAARSRDFGLVQREQRAARRRQQLGLALVSGALLFAGVAGLMISRSADARGGGSPVAKVFAALGDVPASHVAVRQVPLLPPAQVKVSSSQNFSARRPVCVRLCDGFFFPASQGAGYSDASSIETSCAGLCPDAPTSLFYQPAGSDRIEDAVSASGELYSALPVALRYRTVQDATCACHRAIAGAADPMRDPTLRKGDAVMTDKGLMVFGGAEGAEHTSADFTTIAAARLPKAQRAQLLALEFVSRTPQRGAQKSWYASVEPAAKRAPGGGIHFVERGDAGVN